MRERPLAQPVSYADWLRSILLAPTWDRLLLGEGGVGYFVTLAIILRETGPEGLGILQGAGLVALVWATLGLSYAFNDAYDAPQDRHNPKKVQRHVQVRLEQRKSVLLLLGVLQVVFAGVVLLLQSMTVTVGVVGALAANACYSTLLKGVKIWDVVMVACWGALFSVIGGLGVKATILMFLQVGIGHLLQSTLDRGVDHSNSLNTSAQSSTITGSLFLAGLAVMVAVVNTSLSVAAWILVLGCSLGFWLWPGQATSVALKFSFLLPWLAVVNAADGP